MKEKIIAILESYETAYDEISAIDTEKYEEIANEIIKLFEK